MLFLRAVSLRHETLDHLACFLIFHESVAGSTDTRLVLDLSFDYSRRSTDLA